MPDIFDWIGGGVLPIFLVIIVVVLIVSYIGSRYKVAGANEALIVSGQRDRGPDGRKNLKVVRGGGVIVLPLVHKVGKLKLTARQINVALSDAVTRQGIKVAVQGVATFKVGADDESIRNAAERFLEASNDEVDSIVKNVLEGSLRSIVGTLTVEELNLDRQKFQQAVQDAARGDLATSGLQIDSFTIQAIRDESGYMELIGQQETARRERDARMAKAAADQEAAVREAEAEQVKINAARDVSLRRAETETQTTAAQARAAQAGPLAEAEATQEVVRKQTELAELEAARKEKELLTSTVRPAEAEAAAQVRRAEGEKSARIAQAQAEAERVKLAGSAEAAVTVTKGEAQARVVSVNAEAEAQRTTLEGNAEAGITFTKGEAEAKALALRADAYRQFNEAAIIQTVLSMMPEIVRAAAEPIGDHRHPDRPLERRRIRCRQECDPHRQRGERHGQGADRHRHPGPRQQRDRQPAAAVRRRSGRYRRHGWVGPPARWRRWWWHRRRGWDRPHGHRHPARTGDERSGGHGHLRGGHVRIATGSGRFRPGAGDHHRSVGRPSGTHHPDRDAGGGRRRDGRRRCRHPGDGRDHHRGRATGGRGRESDGHGGRPCAPGPRRQPGERRDHHRHDARRGGRQARLRPPGRARHRALRRGPPGRPRADRPATAPDDVARDP